MPSVLIVEDNANFRGLLKETLARRFPWVEIAEAPNFETAVRKIDAALPDFVFVNLELPGRSGLELVRKIGSAHPALAVACLTSYDVPEYREAIRGLNIVAFLSKGSATMDQVVRLVASRLPGQRADLLDDGAG